MQPTTVPRSPTGNEGLDEILGGGLPRDRTCLVQGDFGTGKTTLGLAFLLEGVRRGEPGIYITLTETEQELRSSACSHGWSLDGFVIHEVGGIARDLVKEKSYTVFHPAEVELSAFTDRILDVLERTKPVRVVVDSLSELRLLSADPIRYRRQILTLKRFFIGRPATVMLLEDGADNIPPPLRIESLADGVICLEQVWPELSSMRRRLRIGKMRSIPFRSGYHDFTIETGGLVIYPRVRVIDHHATFVQEMASSGLPDLDVMLGGGLDRGSTALIVGPSGSGKSVLATQIAVAAAERGEHVVFFVFDEVLDATMARADGLQMNLRKHIQSGQIAARQIDPGELAAWQFGRLVLQAAERDRARVIVIDSLDGYLNAMPDERSLDLTLHELFGCLAQLGVITVGTLVRHGFVGERSADRVDISYVSDTVVLLNPFETNGELRKALCVVKRRRGAHEHTIHEFHIGPTGVSIGKPLRGFHGVLTGLAKYVGTNEVKWSKDDESEDR